MVEPKDAGYTLPPCAARGRWQRVSVGRYIEIAIASCSKFNTNRTPSECRACHDRGEDLPNGKNSAAPS